MSKLITLAASVVMATLVLSFNSALACNKINGCTMDTIYESYDMMQSGRMTKAMEEGRANKEAFEALKEQERRSGAAPSNPRRK